jgi:hypothetical protein
MKSLLDKLDDVTAIASHPGNAGADEYMRGMANGLILAQAIMKDQEPKYIEASTGTGKSPLPSVPPALQAVVDRYTAD